MSPLNLSIAGIASTPAPSRVPAWLREPLLHFLIVGAVLFGVDHLVASRADDPLRIEMGEPVDRELRELFEKSRGRAPNSNELRALRQTWLDNEVLYREGLALKVDRGDPAIRERVIFKALSVVDANVHLPPIDDAGLRSWFEARRARYDEPTRYDFQEAVLPGTADEAAVRALVQALDAHAPGSTDASLRVYRGRPRTNIEQSFGAAFADALQSAVPGQWTALQGAPGWRAVRLDAISAPRAAQFESLRGVVMQDWRDATASEQRTAAVRALARKYHVIGSEITP